MPLVSVVSNANSIVFGPKLLGVVVDGVDAR